MAFCSTRLFNFKDLKSDFENRTAEGQGRYIRERDFSGCRGPAGLGKADNWRVTAPIIRVYGTFSIEPKFLLTKDSASDVAAYSVNAAERAWTVRASPMPWLYHSVYQVIISPYRSRTGSDSAATLDKSGRSPLKPGACSEQYTISRLDGGMLLPKSIF